jgi:hypothetical protein
MSVNLSRIEARLRERLCPTCVRYTSRHTCSLPPDRQCALFKNLPAIVDIVRKTQSPVIDPYIAAVRDQVCAVCHYEDEHGACPMRDDLDCALNTYLPIIVDEVERELERIRHERGAPAGGG